MIDHRHNYFMVVDTETCGGLDSPLTYDIGFLVVDSQGRIYERRSYVVYEIFWGQKDLMQSAYYAKKLPQYYDGLQNGEWVCKRFFNIRREMLNLLEQYKVKAVCAYNASFDFFNALNNTMAFILKKEKAYFLPFGTEIWDIWRMACNSFLCHRAYDKMAYENEWVSPKGNVRTSAERAYAYLTGNEDYEERHTALSDCEIEAEILIKCLKSRVKERTVKMNPWKVPQPPFKSYVAKMEGVSN